MSKKRKDERTQIAVKVGPKESITESSGHERTVYISSLTRYLRQRLWLVAIVALLSLGVLGAGLKYLEEDAANQKQLAAKDRSVLAGINPFIPTVPPSSTPQLSKELIYAGSRLLAVEDANASAAPPADIAIWRPSNGNWMVMGQTGSQAVTFGWGVAVDIPVPGDYDGDGKTDFSVFRPHEGIWYIYPSAGGGWITYSWGLSTDLPAPADYDGDGRTDAAIMRPNASTGYSDWYIRQSGTNTLLYQSWGTHTDIPGPADFDGDGRADIAVYRPGTQHYYSINSTDGAFQYIPMGATVNCSIPNRCVVPSDFDGDGRADYALYSASTANWTVRFSASGQTATTQWGAASDIPVQNDYDGDGKTDFATFKDNASPWARWLIKRSSNGITRTEYWGEPGDVPVPAFYRR